MRIKDNEAVAATIGSVVLVPALLAFNAFLIMLTLGNLAIATGWPCALGFETTLWLVLLGYLVLAPIKLSLSQERS